MEALGFLVLLFGSFCTALSIHDLALEEDWFIWKTEYNRSYFDISEELERYAIWQSNKRYIEEHNRHVDVFGFVLKMNNFGDMTSAEFFETTATNDEGPINIESFDHEWAKSKKHGGKNGKHKHHHHHHHHGNNSKMIWGVNEEGYFHLPDAFNESDLPATVDWQASGAVTPVKDQGDCQSSYAFSITGALEGTHALSTGELIPLSEQNIIDCSRCKGGSRESAIYYILDSNGVDTAKSYPYTGSQGMCKFDSKTAIASVSGFVRVKKGSEKDLKAAVAMVGPVTVAVDHRHAAFRFYSYGIFNGRLCSTSKLSHSMLLVGYGDKSKDHWILKNSWGPHWGIDGYMKMVRDGNNQCGIATRALFPKH